MAGLRTGVATPGLWETKGLYRWYTATPSMSSIAGHAAPCTATGNPSTSGATETSIGSRALLSPVIGNSTAKDTAFVCLSIEGSLRAIIVGLAGILPGLITVGVASDVLSLYTSTTTLRTAISRVALSVSSGRPSV